jgi:hypothetical protein
VWPGTRRGVCDLLLMSQSANDDEIGAERVVRRLHEAWEDAGFGDAVANGAKTAKLGERSNALS